MTSRRPDITKTVTHGMKCEGSPDSPSCYWREVAGNFTTIPQYFKEHNYTSVSFGKTFDQRTAGGERCDYPLSWSEMPFQCTTAGTGIEPYNRVSHLVYNPKTMKGSLIDVPIAQAAVDWLGNYTTRTDDNPFFMAVGFHR